MSLRYHILDDAKHELSEAAAHHEEQSTGLGLKLLRSYDAIVDYARMFPTAGQQVELGSHHAVRCFHIRRFHYAVFVCVVDDVLVVLSVSHQKREPGYWGRAATKASALDFYSRVVVP